MKVIKTLLAVALVGLFSSSTLAAGKVVIVNMQAAIIQTDAAQKQLKALEDNSEFAAMKAKFESLRADLMNLDKDAKTNGMTWSEEQRAAHRKNVEYKSADLKLAAEKLKAERNGVIQTIMQQQGEAAKQALSDLVGTGDFGLVLDASTAYFATPDFDLTPEITKKLNGK